MRTDLMVVTGVAVAGVEADGQGACSDHQHGTNQGGHHLQHNTNIKFTL